MNSGRYERTISTILYTDIVGSTELIAERGDKDWAEVIEQHNMAARREFARFNGQEVHITGDGFLVLFATPIQALKCAVAISQAVETMGIKIRCGLHAGEVEMREDRAVGIGLHLGARVVGQAEAGEILVTSTLKDLVEGSGIEFEWKGEFELKGIPGKRGLFAVAPESVAVEAAEEFEQLDMELSKEEISDGHNASSPSAGEAPEIAPPVSDTNIMDLDYQNMVQLDYGSGSFFVVNDRNVIGRGPSADIDLANLDRNSFVSKQHALLFFEDGNWHLEVLKNSSNPTLVNGEFISKGSKVLLKFGDGIRIADVKLNFRKAD